MRAEENRRFTSAAPLACIRALSVSLMLLALSSEPAVADSERLPSAWASGPWEPGPERYGIEIERDVPVKMSDGIVLRADVVYPTDLSDGKRARGTFPVLLQQTPYKAFSADTEKQSRYFVTRGYLYVLAQVRGTYHSGGSFGFLSDREKQDGVELVDWVARRLRGSNGKIGLTGCSYTALNQYFTAGRLGKHSPVKAITPAGIGVDLYREPFFRGGAPTNISELIFSDVFASKLGSSSAPQFSLETAADIKAGGDRAYERSFWQARMAVTAIEQIVRNGIPALIWSGWDDYYPTAAPEAYVMFQNAFAGRSLSEPMKPGQAATGRYQLIMAPGTHCSGGEGGPRDEAALKWFDTWVKGVQTGLQNTQTPLQLYQLQSNRWVSASSYPLSTDYQTFYLEAGGELRQGKPTANSGSDRIRYAQSTEQGAILMYTTQPFENGATIAGPIAMRVYANSSNASLELIATLFDVGPEGTETRLTTGALVGSMRALEPTGTWYDSAGHPVRPHHSFTQDDPLVPGKITEFDIGLQPRDAAFLPGHKLRLVLSTQSDTNDCATKGNELWCIIPTKTQERAFDGGVYEVQRNQAWASYLNVPVLPYVSTGVQKNAASASPGNERASQAVTLRLPMSRFISGEARQALQRWTDLFEGALKSCHADQPDAEAVAARRRCLDEHLFASLIAKDMARYNVSIHPETIGGVYTEVITPAEGVSRKNSNRVLINLHGGAFVLGARSGGQVESIPIAALGNIKVVSVDYRMAPEHEFPAASEDVAAVYRALLKDYKPGNIGIYGCSAGGLLTAEAIAWLEKERLPLPGAVGMFCAGAGYYNWGDSGHIAAAMTGAPGGSVHDDLYFRNTNPEDALAFPASSAQILAKFPPSLLISATRDLALSSVVYTHSRLVEQGVEAELHVWEGLGHAFFYDPDIPQSREVYAVITRFFDRHLGGH
jgi:predicted acyl esterase/acetyl esterase/lipase